MTQPMKKQTAAQATFSDFTKYITENVLEKYGPSYANPQNTRNTWRAKIQYSPEIDSFIVFRAGLFIRLLNDNNPNFTNPQFLRSLTNLMADYLSAYMMKRHGCPTRKNAYKSLQRELYDENPYIQKILSRQAAAKISKPTTHMRRTRFHQECQNKMGKPAINASKRPGRPKSETFGAATRKLADSQKIRTHAMQNVISKGK